ncbi:MAG: hypothetical protein U0892_13450 [Pirellulales bacterium]
MTVEFTVGLRRVLLVWAGSWFAVWTIWLYLTASFHPTFSLALIVTTSLIAAYAAAVACNHWLLLPRLSANGNAIQYALSLAITMAGLTATALTVIRISYLLHVGPDADPYGVYKHYLIDLFGMAVHVAVAAIIIWLISRTRSGSGRLVKHD